MIQGTRHILGIYSGAQSHTKAAPRPYERHLIGNPKPHQSHLKATPKPHQSHTKATPKPHQSHTKATPKPHQSRPRPGKIRKPKAESRRKSEVRSPNSKLTQRTRHSGDRAIFGFRVSAFFRVSGFGLRISVPRKAPLSSSQSPPALGRRKWSLARN